MLLAAALAFALVVPSVPPGRVADYARLLTPAAAARIDARLAEHEGRTGTQMVVAIFRSLEGEDLEDYSIRLAQQWRVGRKGLDDGVILLVFLDERRVRLEVGYGLEPVVPDAEAGRIVRDVIAPAFREQRYAEGIERAVEAVYARVGGEAGPAPAARSPPRVPLVALLLVGAVVVIVLMSMAAPGPRARRRGYTADRHGWYAPTGIPPRWGGGRGGFGGGGFSGRGGSFGGGGASGSW